MFALLEFRTKRAQKEQGITSLFKIENQNYQLEKGFFFVHLRTVLAVKRVHFLSNRVSYRVLRGHWFNIIVLNVLSPSEGKNYSSRVL
jgi:hypothetical protein